MFNVCFKVLYCPMQTKITDADLASLTIVLNNQPISEQFTSLVEL